MLDFVDFQRFVKLLKGRPELRRLYQRLRTDSATDKLDFGAFERFMRDSQKVRPRRARSCAAGTDMFIFLVKCSCRGA